MGAYVQLLGREGAATDTGGVRFDDTDDGLDLEGRDGQAGDYTTDTSVGTGDEGVCAVVNIQHEGIRAFDEDSLVCLERPLHEQHRIDNIRPECLIVDLVLLQLLLHIILQQVSVALLISVCQSTQLYLERLPVEELVDADPAAGGLGGVGWADTLLCCTDACRAEGVFF